MVASRPKILVVGNQQDEEQYLAKKDLDRLQIFSDWQWLSCTASAITGPDGLKLHQHLDGIDGLVVCPSAPYLDAQIMDQAPKLKIIGQLNGDRFAKKIDLEAAWERNIRTVDTTNGSSYPVSEWALGLILLSLRNIGYYMHRYNAGQYNKTRDNPGYLNGELTGKRVGLIGCGHAGRRLIEFLRPFNVEIFVYDPYLPREIAEALGFVQTSLENVLSQCDAIVCLAPETPRTIGMIGKEELDLIPSGTVLVNVSRGPIIDSIALVERLKRGDIIAGLDVFDPEPMTPGHEILNLDNVFLTPHIAGVTAAAYLRFFELMVDEMDRFFHGHETYFDLTPQTLANRQGNEPMGS